MSGAEKKTKVRVALVGDSTVTDRSGWGKAFSSLFVESVEVHNFAVGGRSSKSWYEEGRLPEVLQAAPDYVLIQFGHNDQPGKGPERETDPSSTYRDFLRLYVTEFRAIGAQPIILSSVVRRQFDGRGAIRSSLTPWAEAAAQVARQMEVPFIDLHALSLAYHEQIGPEKSWAFNPEEDDVTHFNEEGGAAMAALIAGQLDAAVADLAAHLKK